VVDDRKNAADILAKLLKKKGHDVQTAYGGQEALLAAEKFRPELLLLDIGMPNMNGYEVCRQIRKQPLGRANVSHRSIRLGKDRRRSSEAGFSYHLVKPVQSTMLLKLLDSIGKSNPNTNENPILSDNSDTIIN
jgi:CheY-like chemotaxis protein